MKNVTREDFINVGWFSSFSENMKDELITITNILEVDERETIFREGDSLESFYIVKNGKVLLEKNISNMVTVCLGAIDPVNEFGVLSIVASHDIDTHDMDAVAAEPSRILEINRAKFLALMDANPKEGLKVLYRFLNIFKVRRDESIQQFLRTIQKLPEIQDFISTV